MNPVPPELQGKFVDAPTLVKILFPESCRPSVQWIRDQQAARKIPFVRLGRLVFFDPERVRAAILDMPTMKGRSNP